MNKSLLDKVVNCPRLPSLPTVAVNVIELCRDDNVKIEEIANTLSNDPALSGKVLKTVNSSYYGLRQSVTTISQAIVILGLNSVKTLALSFSLVNALKGATGEDFDPNKFWRRVLYSATGAKVIAEHLGMEDQEEVFLGALLQDIGVLAMMQQLGKPYINILSTIGDRHEELTFLETMEFDLTHASVGAELAERWKLPSILIEPIKFHEKPESASAALKPLVRAVALGALSSSVFLEHPKDALETFYKRAHQWFKIDKQDADQIIQRIDLASKELGRFFEIDASGANDIGSILVEANEVLQDVTFKAQQDNAKLQEENKTLEEKATKDALTGISNRGHFNDRLKFHFEHASRQGQPVSLILFDADHFKAVNDTHGHPAGDAVLVHIAKTVEDLAPESAIVARYGGEEFAIILPNTERKDAAFLAEEVRKTFETLPIDIDDALQLTVTASIGVATFDGLRVFTKPEQLIKAADQAVYAAKYAGRNCVRVFAPKVKASS